MDMGRDPVRATHLLSACDTTLMDTYGQGLIRGYTSPLCFATTVDVCVCVCLTQLDGERVREEADIRGLLRDSHDLADGRRRRTLRECPSLLNGNLCFILDGTKSHGRQGMTQSRVG
mgnify:FL=1